MQEQVIDVSALGAHRPVEFPEAFSHLRPYAAWSLDTETARNIKRHATPMEEIRSFVDVMLSSLDAIFAYLDEFDLANLPPPARALMNMTLSLAEVAPAVEFYGQQAVIDGFDPRRFHADDHFVLSPRF
ncbi:hypothetical protein UC34_07175 [Pandoraea vervacti]|uniref:Uncharacterized protein n=1 Tax=Pandoraea vervacti TaxID=656178 RepID=A0ABM5SWE0_9BURK|nr:hypothetical protein [Pandoraea vervacti]AJP56831.1 hypothetical protein UC34_07175 [Pandoraea vervacti]